MSVYQLKPSGKQMPDRDKREKIYCRITSVQGKEKEGAEADRPRFRSDTC